ncbi:TonB-dependent receptor [Pseudoalteromonas tunicata]|uniref:TonB-dependent receptor n=1 Tax=Pseudoalteromonas tunicata TaxID=314281 RepID=UPI00273D2640|nr:TonB-dependent receptor [Pseudoalteromonas tunicata]MDP5214710.1 TonB-dependent receptor [Pseudoalteromonas tunicata]
MKNNTWKFKRSMTALAVASCLLSLPNAYANNAFGSAYGKAQAGVVVTIKNDNTGLSRKVSVGEDGRFDIKNLPVGQYTVIDSLGNTDSVIINVGTGSIINLEGTERITVVGARVSSIDTTSVESTSVFSASDFELLPVGRDLTSVALLAPGTVQGDSEFGNLASFGGSSVAENGYYLNGFDITDSRKLLSFANIPFDAIASQQVKTGGYGAEYGRSLGGVVNQVTKSGTNEWQFSASVHTNLDALRAEPKDVKTLNQDTLSDPYGAHYLKYRKANTNDATSYVLTAGGPLIEDKLFVFAALEGFYNENDDYFQNESRNIKRTSPQGLVKVDWYLTDDHIFEFTGVYNKKTEERTIYDNPNSAADPDHRVPYTGKHGEHRTSFDRESGGHIAIAKYTGILTDDFSLSVMLGDLKSVNDKDDPEVPDGVDTSCNRIWDSSDNARGLVHRGCWNEGTVDILDPDTPEEYSARTAIRIDGEYQLGDHSIRFGFDEERLKNVDRGWVYVGDDRKYYRYFEVGSLNHAFTKVNGVELEPGTPYVRIWDGAKLSAEYKSVNSAIYIEDSWQVSDDLLLYAGLRWESFKNENSEGAAFVDAKNELAPRFGFSWDVDGNSEKKLFASLGRYFIPVPGNTNERLSGVEYRDVSYHYYDGYDERTWVPNITGDIGDANIENKQAPNPASIVSQDLRPMFQDEFILGYQQEIFENWTVGIKGIYRKIKNGMDDFCSPGDIYKWALDQGYNQMDWHDIPSCIVLNPGEDLNFQVDTNDDGTVEDVTVPNSYLGLPEYQRDYKAIELSFNRGFVDGWNLGGSYVWSKSQGNVEGYVNSGLGQDDPGITQDFDHRLFQENTYGYTPNDRRHAFKAYGSYELTQEIIVSLSFNATSGQAKNCLGFVPYEQFENFPSNSPEDITYDRLARYSASSFYCRNEAGERELTTKGQYGRTPWTFNTDLSFKYTPTWADDKLSLRARLLNVFNAQKTVSVEPQGDFGRDSTAKNPDFLVPLNFQTPRRLYLSLSYKF